ncbi:MAG: glycine cleavage system aminomethyltransferase GcvT [Oscillospiraceae bacterium]
MEKKTPLYQQHVEAGGKMVPFAGYLMPVQYPAGVIAEHLAVRRAAGLFDVSHMGEVLLTGPASLAVLQNLLANNMEGMQNGDCRYSPMCNEQGGVVDDLIVYRFHSQKYMIVVNAANAAKDLAWMQAHLAGEAALEDVSSATALLALQGPKAEEILRPLATGELPGKNYTFKEKLAVAGVECLVSRTGYTGEDGFELYCAAEEAPRLWQALLAAGQGAGLVPCGLGARDTLRLEAAMPLYGHEMNDEITPLEAGLGMFVKMDKPGFVGKQALEAKGPPEKRRTGLKMTGRGIAREGAPVYQNGVQVGVVTSGTQLPYVGYAGAMALLQTGVRQEGTPLVVEVRGRQIEAEVVKLPFYKRQKA